MIVGVAVVPTTPLVLEGLPGRAHPDLQRIGAAARRATEGLARAEVVVALAGGARVALSGRPDTTLDGFGLAGLSAHDPIPAPAAVLDVLRRALPAARQDAGAGEVGAGEADAEEEGSAWLGPDMAVLARHLPASARCAALTVPADTADDVVAALAAALGEVAAATAVALLVAGDLAAGHGHKPPRPEAARVSDTFDQTVVAALDGGRPSDLLRMDADLIAASASRAAGALRVLGAVLAGAPTATVVRTSGAPLGVGYVVAQGG